MYLRIAFDVVKLLEMEESWRKKAGIK